MAFTYCEDNVTHDLVFKYRHALFFIKAAAILNQMPFNFNKDIKMSIRHLLCYFFGVYKEYLFLKKQIALAQITYYRSIFQNPCFSFRIVGLFQQDMSYVKSTNSKFWYKTRAPSMY